MANKPEGVVILGSTGSIGKSTLAVIKQNTNRYRVDGLSCHDNISLLAEQIKEFSPHIVSVGKGKSEQLKQLLGDKSSGLEIFEGSSGHLEVAKCKTANKIIAAMVGSAGIEPVMAGIRAGKTIALANKESLVLAGSLLISEAEKHSVSILPIDSEHNAVFQSLNGESRKSLDHITLTASGGPFRQTEYEDFKDITLKDALNHPNWSMGKKITIDSATMMNKCLEIIEAKWLFNLAPEQIKVLVHPQSIVHSMVTYKDASTICQMGIPDMRIPIANCLGFPERIESGCEFLNLSEIGTLTFEEPDFNKFPTLQMAYDVLELGGGTPAALNGANEVLVDLFLKEEIPFLQIFESLKNLVQSMKKIFGSTEISKYPFLKNPDSISDAIKADSWGRDYISEHLSSQ